MFFELTRLWDMNTTNMFELVGALVCLIGPVLWLGWADLVWAGLGVTKYVFLLSCPSPGPGLFKVLQGRCADLGMHVGARGSLV